MNFLYPIYLAGILAAVLPVMIHLLTKRQKKHLIFSDLTLLREVDADEAPRYRWENLSLMILRALCLAILALVFCQPVWKAGGGLLQRPGQGTAAVFVIDASRSMGASEGGVTRYEKAKQMALQYLDQLRGEDEAMVIFASSHTRTSHDSPVPFREEVQEAIEQSTVTPYASAFSAAVRSAVELALKSPQTHKEIYLFTDCQKTALVPAPQSWPEGAEAIHGYVGYLPDNLALPNLEITDLSVSPLAAKSGDPIEVGAKVLGHGSEVPGEVEMHLETGPNTRLYRNLTLVSGVPSPVVFGLTRTEADVDSGLIEIQSDALESDNLVRYSLPHVRPMRALMTQGGGGEETLLFLQLALRFLTQSPVIPKISAEYVDIQKLPDQLASENVDVVFVANPGRIDSNWVRGLSSWVRDGGNLVLAMGNVPTQQVNELLVPGLIPTRVERWDGNPKESAHPTSFDFSHPWMDRFEKQEDADWPSVQVWGGFDFVDKTDLGLSISQLMILDRRTPLLWQRDLGLGTVSGWMSTIDDKWNDAPRSGLYLALWGEFFRTLAEKKGLSPSFTAGSQIPIEVVRKDDQATEVHVIDPNGREDVLAVAGPKLVQTLYFTRSDVVGEYRVTFNESRIERLTPSAFAVNIEPGEGDLSGLPFEEVEKLYPFPLLKMDDRGSLAAAMVHSRYGYGLWPYVLAAVILLLLGEAWLGRPSS